MELGLIQTRTGNDISFSRHPLTYLVEAADDICYTIIDFEDGINLGLISEDYALEYLIKLVKDRIDTAKYNSLNFKEDRLSYLRALAISTLINDAVKVFVENEETILSGEFDISLLEKSTYEAQISDIISLSVENIYRSSEVLEKEIAGYKIISDILEVCTGAMVRRKKGESSNYDTLILQTMPEKYRIEHSSIYDILVHCCCFVASLSDSMAVHIHRKITGLEI